MTKPTLLVAVLTIALTACTPSIPATVKADPPRIDCKQAAGPALPDWPAGDAWLTDGKAYAVQLLGIITDARIASAKQDGCIDNYRKAGLIR